MKYLAMGILLFSAIQGFAETTNGLHWTLGTRTVELWDFKGLLGYASMRSGMPLDFSTNSFAGVDHRKTGVRCTFRGTEIRQVVAWVVKFLDGTARIEDGTLVVRPKSEQPSSDPVFECTEETDGAWKAPLERQLVTPMGGPLEGIRDFNPWVKVIAEKAELSLILDPRLSLSSAEMPALPQGANGQPWGDLLKSGLKGMGLTYRLQGGVVFITK